MDGGGSTVYLVNQVAHGRSGTSGINEAIFVSTPSGVTDNSTWTINLLVTVTNTTGWLRAGNLETGNIAVSATLHGAVDVARGWFLWYEHLPTFIVPTQSSSDRTVSRSAFRRCTGGNSTLPRTMGHQRHRHYQCDSGTGQRGDAGQRPGRSHWTRPAPHEEAGLTQHVLDVIRHCRTTSSTSDCQPIDAETRASTGGAGFGRLWASNIDYFPGSCRANRNHGELRSWHMLPT